MWPGLPSRGLENDYVCLKRCFWETEMDRSRICSTSPPHRSSRVRHAVIELAQQLGLPTRPQLPGVNGSRPVHARGTQPPLIE